MKEEEIFSKSAAGIIPESVDTSEFNSFRDSIISVYMEEGSDKMNVRHAYYDTYARLMYPLLSLKNPTIAEVGVLGGSSLRAMHRLIPNATIYGFDINKVEVDCATVIVGDGYKAKTWESVPYNVDLIIDDGSHNIVDMVRGMHVFMNHLSRGGYLLIEDVWCMNDLNSLLTTFPGGEVVDTRKKGAPDDITVVWRKV